MKEIFVDNLHNSDLYIHNYGEETCMADHNFGPGIRDFYIIHFILEGKGIFKYEGKTYNLGKDQLFLINPGIVAQYKADHDQPWHYMWVGFSGDKAEEYLAFAGLNHKEPVSTLKKSDQLVNAIRGMIDTGENYRIGQDVKLQGLLYVFLSEIIEANVRGRDWENHKNLEELYLYRGIQQMIKNYSSDTFTINALSKYLNLDRSYFSCLFTRNLQDTPYQYLMEIRLSKACELLWVTDLAIKEVAISVGYKDYAVFSKAFKRKYGCTPTEYRQKHA